MKQRSPRGTLVSFVPLETSKGFLLEFCFPQGQPPPLSRLPTAKGRKARRNLMLGSPFVVTPLSHFPAIQNHITVK